MWYAQPRTNASRSSPSLATRCGCVAVHFETIFSSCHSPLQLHPTFNFSRDAQYRTRITVVDIIDSLRRLRPGQVPRIYQANFSMFFCSPREASALS